MKKFHTFAFTLAAIVLLALLPLVPLMQPSSCVGHGQEYQVALYAMGTSVWVSVIAWPLALFSLVIWIIALIAHLVIRRRSRGHRDDQVA